MRRKVRLTESQLNRIVKQSVRKILKESIDPLEKIIKLIDEANDAYANAAKITEDDEPLYDKKNNLHYGLKSKITLDKRGYVTIPFQSTIGKYGGFYSSTEKIRVVGKSKGKTKILNDVITGDGWNYVKALLKQIIKDANNGIYLFQNYDPNIDDEMN